MNDNAIMAAIYIWEATPKRCRIAQNSLGHHENYDVAEVIPELLVEPEELSFDDSVPNFGPETFG